MTIEHHQFDLDGVEVHHFPSDDAVTSAVLTFGVGARNETLPTGGVLHVLEHLVMDAVRQTPIEINACVGDSFTEFEASGSPQHVGAFLEAVCRQLNDPSVSRLAAEIKVLEAEEHSDGGGGSGTPLLSARYGWRDLGTGCGPLAGPRAATPETIRAAAARWFVTGNAMLTVDGPWPAELRLPLRSGSRPATPPAPIKSFHTPSAIIVEDPVCAVSLLLPHSDTHLEVFTASALRQRLTERLRHEHGLVYDVDEVMTASGDGRWYFEVVAQPSPRHSRQTVTTMVEAVLSLLRDGLTETELERGRELSLEESRGREAAISFVTDAAKTGLLGLRTTVFDPRFVSDLDAASLHRYLRSIGGDVLFAVGEDDRSELKDLALDLWPGPGSQEPLPPGELFRPGLVARALSRDARESRVSLTATGLSHLLDGIVQTIGWVDVVAVMRLAGDDDLVIFGADGSSITVGPGLYRRGERLLEAVRQHVPNALFYDEPPEPED